MSDNLNWRQPIFQIPVAAKTITTTRTLTAGSACEKMLLPLSRHQMVTKSLKP